MGIVSSETERVSMKQFHHTKEHILPSLLLCVLLFWILINSHFLHRYIELIQTQRDCFSTMLGGLVILWLVITSFYASFHLMSFLFSVSARIFPKRSSLCYKNTPAVAILYPCMNDMSEKSLASCLAQDYPDYTLFILDDSTAPDEKRRVEDFVQSYGERVSIIRRETRSGFKAGNLNHAVQCLSPRYEYLCVLDADELIPSNFLREMIAIAEGRKDVAFVQASHSQYSQNEYGRRTGQGIDCHWNYFLPARNRFGFVYFYGHGAIFRREAITSINGFPEVVSEDIALSTRLREAGYRGLYTFEVKSLEETPASYEAFRKRNRKVVMGTLEFAFRLLPSFLRSKTVPVVEKVDLLISTSVIYQPIMFVFFLLLFHGLLLLIKLKHGAYASISLIGFFQGEANTPWVVFKPLADGEAIAFVLFTVFAPLCYLVPNAIFSPKKVAGYVIIMSGIYLSLCIDTLVSAIKWAVTRRASFNPTGERLQPTTQRFRGATDAIVGLGLVTLGILTASPCLIAVSLSLMLVPLLLRSDYNVPLLFNLIAIPLVITVIAIFGLPIMVLGAASIFCGVGITHH